MTDEQRADLEAGKRAVVFNADADVPVGSIIDDTLPPSIAGIIEQVQAIEDAEAAQQHDGGDAASNKAAMKLAMGCTEETQRTTESRTFLGERILGMKNKLYLPTI